MARTSPVILIVVDEFLPRMDSVEVLEDAGFEVIPAVNADEAIAILSARSDIHVVFTDIQTPGSMDGLKLARFVRDRGPRIKIFATSGHVHIEDNDLSFCLSRTVAPKSSRFCGNRNYLIDHSIGYPALKSGIA